MTPSDPLRWGFLAAAAFNILGVLITTRGFTADPIGPLYPELFGRAGCALIVVWGLAYASVASRWRELPALCGVFAVEKLFYGLSWVRYWTHPSTPTWADHRAHHPDAVLFLTTYGLGDLLFAVGFAYAAWSAARRR